METDASGPPHATSTCCRRFSHVSVTSSPAVGRWVVLLLLHHSSQQTDAFGSEVCLSQESWEGGRARFCASPRLLITNTGKVIIDVIHF